MGVCTEIISPFFLFFFPKLPDFVFPDKLDGVVPERINPKQIKMAGFWTLFLITTVPNKDSTLSILYFSKLGYPFYQEQSCKVFMGAFYFFFCIIKTGFF